MLRVLTVAALLIGFLFDPSRPLRGAEVIESGTRSRPDFTGALLNGTESFRGRDTTQDIRLKAISYLGQASNLLYLDFDAELPALLKDASGHFHIREANYIATDDARIGRGAALFNRADNRIVIDSPEELWPGPRELGDFSIELWLKPGHYYNKNMLFQKSALEPGLLEGRRKSMEVYIWRQQMYFRLENLFYDATGATHTLQLVSRSRIPLHRWTHVTLTYQASEGRLAMYLNGREERVVLARPGWKARFSRVDRSPIVIGGNFSGLLDEVRIADRAVSPEQGGNHFTSFAPIRGAAGREFQPGGMVTSGVTRLKDEDIARKAHLRYRAEMPVGTILKFWVRFSRRRFDRDTSERILPWYRIDGETEKLPPFSYVQWKAELKADPMGRPTPVLKEVALEYTPFATPGSPRRLRVIQGLTGAGRICLEWSANPAESETGSIRYAVYYGVRPGEYTGRLDLRLENGRLVPIGLQSPEQLPLSRGERERYSNFPERKSRDLANRIRLMIDNALIIGNIKRSGRRDMPLLENDRAYYFAVTAYTRYRQVKLESKHSDEVSTVLKPRPDL